jgi:predicted AAA+ superfamily ATPase
VKRSALLYLENWLMSQERKPVVVRGARQVGKTWLIRNLAKESKYKLIELNFEKYPEYKTLFNTNDPHQIIKNIESRFNIDVVFSRSILFLDEVQAAPELLAKLRWFAEDLPELAVAAAGSLLDFVLDEHEFSMPVGRITYLYLEPLSFEEFLLAKNKSKSLQYIENYQWKDEIPETIHLQLLALFKEYIIVGGMPAAVYSWAQKKPLEFIHRIHTDLLSSYRDDFSKYAGRISTNYLEDIMTAVPKMLGQKFILSKVNKEKKVPAIKSALNLICSARVANRIVASAGNGVPLGAEKNDKFFKVNFLDVGLVSSMLGLKLNQLSEAEEINLINQGSVSEQVVGQLLRCIEPEYIDPALYYWMREQKGASAEVDYLIQQGSHVMPVEVKSGATGSLKSLHNFMSSKKLKTALRINSDFPSVVDVEVKIQDGTGVKYTLHSIPFYLISQVKRLLTI